LQPESGIPGQPPYTIRWFWNTTGHFSANSPGTFLGQGQNITISPYPACPVFWLKCEVTSSDGVRVSRIHKVKIGPSECCEEEPEEKTTAFSEPLVSKIGELFPNPVSEGFVNLTLEKGLNANVNFQILDVSGRILSTGNIATGSEGRLKIDINSLNSGVYLL
jgi:hypothetical protein